MPELADCTTEALVEGVAVDFRLRALLKLELMGFSPTGSDTDIGFDPAAEETKLDANGGTLNVVLGTELILENSETGCAVC